jgi:sugar-specific transcriptional regulator TrmB
MQIKDYSLVEKLVKAGFSDKEAKIYVALLELGGAFPSKVAEYTDINRSTVYHTLAGLSIRGVVNEIEKRNKFFYQAERPEKVIRFAEGQIRRAEDQLDQMKSILPAIEGLYGLSGSRPKVTYYENTDGIVSIYEDMISMGKKYEMLAWSNAAELENVFPEKFFERFRRTKERIGITTRGIVPDTEGDKTYSERLFKGYKKEVIPELKFISASKFPFKGEITIYGENKVAIVNLNKQFLTGIIIEDETIHNMMRLMFEMSWDSKMVKVMI